MTSNNSGPVLSTTASAPPALEANSFEASLSLEEEKLKADVRAKREADNKAGEEAGNDDNEDHRASLVDKVLRKIKS